MEGSEMGGARGWGRGWREGGGRDGRCMGGDGAGQGRRRRMDGDGAGEGRFLCPTAQLLCCAPLMAAFSRFFAFLVSNLGINACTEKTV